MNIIIVGCGRLGSHLAKDLSFRGHNVTVLDEKEDNLKCLGTTFNGIKLVGTGIDEELLRNAGAENADVFFAITNSDNTNIMSCLIARKIFKIPRILARIYEPKKEVAYKEVEIEAICPTNIAADIFQKMINGDDK